MSLLIVALLWLVAPALALDDEIVLVSLDGAPRSGVVAPLAVVAVRSDAVAEADDLVVSADCGEVVSRVRRSDGTWRVQYRAPDEGCPGDTVHFQVVTDGRERTESMTLGSTPTTTLVAPPRIEAVAGQQRPITFLVRRSDGSPLASDDLLVSAPEGEFTGLLATAQGVTVSWVPEANRFPHIVPIAVADRTVPGSALSWSVVELTARPSIPVRSEAGSEVRVRISNRTFGPATADASGTAHVSVETRPGDTVAEVFVVDPRGNTQKSQLALGTDPRPTLFAVAESGIVVGQPMPAVHLVALAADGRPWTGRPPTCVSGLGDNLTPSPRGPGRWQLALPVLPAELFFDLRVDCSLDERTRTTLRVPVETGLPSKLVLRSYPPELAADVPIAQVQAHLENRAGDRLPAVGITLTAGRGVVTIDEQGGAALQARYDGRSAVALGADVLTASWNLPAGSGAVWGLRVAAEAIERRAPGVEGQGTDAPELATAVYGRALDRLGRPLHGVALELAAGSASTTAVTDERGWARALFPAVAPGGLLGIEVRAGSLVRAGLMVGGEPVVDDGGGPSWPDLIATTEIPIRSGRVRQVFIATEPTVLETGGAATARVIVRLLDKAGNPVTDEAIELTTDNGVVTRPRRRSDGSFEATYAPPPGLPYGTVQITAAGAGDAFSASTTLEIVPREVRRSTGAVLGTVLGRSGLPRPWVGIEHDERLRWANNRVYARFSAAFFTDRAQVVDEVGRDPVEMSIGVVPLGVGLLGRTERGRITGWLGSSVELAPYQLDARYGQTVGARGVGLASPGFAVYSGGGWRLRSGEVQLQLAYHFVSVPEPDIGWQGQVAGLVASVGYKLIY